MREIREEQSGKRHEETISIRASSSSSGSGNGFVTQTFLFCTLAFAINQYAKEARFEVLKGRVT